MKLFALTSLLLLAALGCGGGDPGASPRSTPGGGSSATVIYFFDPDCPDCKEVESAHLEAVAVEAGCPIELVERVDVTSPAGARRLLALAPAARCKVLAPILVVGEDVLCGIEEIRVAHGPAAVAGR